MSKATRIQKGDQVKSLVALKTHQATFPAGTIFVVEKRYRGLWLVQRDRCPHCGIRLRIGGIEDWRLEKLPCSQVT